MDLQKTLKLLVGFSKVLISRGVWCFGNVSLDTDLQHSETNTFANLFLGHWVFNLH